MAGIVARATSCRRVAFLGCDAMMGGEAFRTISIVGAKLVRDGAVTAVRFLLVYISISAVTAAIGFAFTASHLEKPQVTKGSCPFRSVARSGPAPWARRHRPSMAGGGYRGILAAVPTAQNLHSA